MSSAKLRYFFTLGESTTSRPIQLPFSATRERSPLLFATIVFIGARSLARTATASFMYDEARRLCHSTFLSEPDGPPDSLSLKAVILLSMYTGLPDILAHAITLSWRLRYPVALLDYAELSEIEKASTSGRKLLQMGRTFLITYLWTSYYSNVRGLHGGFELAPEVMVRQMDILEASEMSQQPGDRAIRTSVIKPSSALCFCRATKLTSSLCV